MKKKLMVIVLTLSVLCSLFTMQTVGVLAEEVASIDDNLRVWFNFSEETSLGEGRGNIFFDANQSETVMGIYGQEVTIVQQGLNGRALHFAGITGFYEEELGMLWNNSGFYILSMEDLLTGDNITTNIVFQNETNEQMQPIFCSGATDSDYMVLMTSWASENSGPRIATKANNTIEQTITSTTNNIPQTGTWNMLTYVQEGTTGKIYLNGKLLSETDLQYKLADTKSHYVESENAYIYSLGAPTVFENDPGFKGLVDDFRIYGSALTETEIQELATSLNIEVDTDDNNNNENEGTDSTTPADGVVIDWDFSNEDSIADVTLGNGVTVENGKATFAPGNEGIALPDDIFKDAETVTVEMTLQPSAFANYRALLCGGNQNGKWFVMGVMEDGAVRYALATNGDDNSESKGNSTTGSQGNAHASYQSGAVLTTDAEHTVKYVITQAETNVYIDGELALTLPTADKDAIGSIGGPVVLGKATKWPDSSYEGTISSLKITVEKTGAGSGEGEGSGEGGNSGNQGGAGDASGDNTTTGDVASVVALLVAGTAALGGLKLKKKAK